MISFWTARRVLPLFYSLFLALLPLLTQAEVTYKLYDNAALAGEPIRTGTSEDVQLSLKRESTTATTNSNEPGCFLSGELVGTLQVYFTAPGKSVWYEFDCRFEKTSTGFVWIDGHLVCQDSNAFRPNPPGFVDNPLLVSPRHQEASGHNYSRSLPFRAHIMSNDTSCQQGIASLSVTLKRMNAIKEEDSSDTITPTTSTNTVTPRRLQEQNNTAPNLHRWLPSLSQAESQRDLLQRTLGYGWGSWLRHDMVSLVQLPQGIVLTPQLCHVPSKECLDFAIPDLGKVRVGLHAYDRSYVSYHMAYKDVNVTMEYSAQGNQLYYLITTNAVNTNHTVADYEIRIHGRYGWFRPGTVTVVNSATLDDMHPQLEFTAPGFGVTIVSLASNNDNNDHGNLQPGSVKTRQQRRQLSHDSDGMDDQDDDGRFLRVPLPKLQDSIGFAANLANSDKAITTREIQDIMHSKKAEEEHRIRTKFGPSKLEVAVAIQSAAMWTLIYNPAENGALFMPVSRTESWSFRDRTGASTTDWTYVIFDWDNLFASLLAGLDNKEVAYSNLFQVVKSKTATGFVPNLSSGGVKTQDRTEPPVGAKVTLELFRKYRDPWAVEVVFDDLLDWNNWFLANRILQPAGLVALGSAHNEANGNRTICSLPTGVPHMQCARWESGMDNSPMYDGDLFDDESALMQLYDVGMSSMFVQEAYSLAELAAVIGRKPELVNMLRARGDAMRDKIASHLWDDESQIFVNRFPNGTFYRHVSPTSFYPLFTGAATAEQADIMVQSWLLNSSRFCISPEGDFAGNDPDRSYWGLPSISADDPQFMASNNNYWRGLSWGPLAKLTYWSLQQNSGLLSESKTATTSSPILSKARKALCKQMEQLLMSQWHAHHHICENYHPTKNYGDCVNTPFYHWGALTGLIGMVEDGFW